MNDLKGIIEDCNKSDLVSKKVIEKVIKIIGQKRWNRIHDEESDICTTMGELIITLKGIPDLEKENAELREQCSILADCNTCISACKTENIKAKELLRELYSIVKVECSPFAREEHKNILTETLEFLKEE